jgi:hypothetical protein
MRKNAGHYNYPQQRKFRPQQAMGRLSQSVYLLAFFLAFTIFSGCNSLPSATPVRSQSSVAENFVLPSRVAVLPFKNETDIPDAAIQVRRIFYNYFSSLNYRDSELFTVDTIFKKNDWFTVIAKGESLPWRKICKALNIDGFITGTVSEYGKMYAVLYAQTEVTMNVQFRSCTNGSFIWEEEAQETKRDGDIPFSPTGLAAALVTTFIKHQDITALEVAAKLSMKMTLNMPNPVSLLAVPPEISLFLHNGNGRLLLPKQVLKVVLLGEPGQKAYWSIPKLASRMKMIEREPGIYVGQYQVRAEDRVVRAQLVAFLVSRENAETRWVDVLESVSLGSPTILPAVIAEDLVLSPHQSPYLISDIVLVKQNVQLRILPGTAVWSAGAGLVVNGQLLAKGQASNRISFRSLSDSAWKGITLNQTSAPCQLDYVDIDQADIALNAFKSKAEITGLQLEDNRWGIVAQDSDLKIENSLIRHSQHVGISSRNSQINLQSNYISYNKTGGAQFEASEVAASNNAIFANGKWNIRNLDTDSILQLGNNWWGTATTEEIKVIGNVNMEPLLEKSPAGFFNQ